MVSCLSVQLPRRICWTLGLECVYFERCRFNEEADCIILCKILAMVESKHVTVAKEVSSAQNSLIDN